MQSKASRPRSVLPMSLERRICGRAVGERINASDRSARRCAFPARPKSGHAAGSGPGRPRHVAELAPRFPPPRTIFALNAFFMSAPPDVASLPRARLERSRQLARRVLSIAAVACLTVVALYVVAANAFLWTGLFERVVDADPDTLDVHYERGWSLLPGHVHAKKLSIRGRDSNVEWMLRIDSVEFRVSLF